MDRGKRHSCNLVNHWFRLQRDERSNSIFCPSVICWGISHRCSLPVWYALAVLERPTSFWAWSVFFLGGTECGVALTLVLLAPSYLAAFISGWVALKFALGWQREENKSEVLTGSMLSLIGNVISFAIAIAVGVLLYPDVLKIWAATSKAPASSHWPQSAGLSGVSQR